MKWSKAEVMCYRKKRYPNLIKAHCALGKMLATYPDAPLHQWHVYECPVCRGFHLTKQPQDNPEYQKRRWMAGLDISPKCATLAA